MSRITVRAIAVCCCLGSWAAAASPEIRLTLVSSWSKRQNFAIEFQNYLDAVNEAGRGIVQIDYLGGPEVIPEQQQLYALRRGVIDMEFGGVTYYRGLLPEGDAIFGSTLTPMQARANGALEALQPYWAERINAYLIGWLQSGIGVNLYLADAPRFDAAGLPDLSGLKIRTSPSNREMLLALGARTVQIPVRDIYTALQRGTVDGLAYTSSGMPELGVERFIRYRLEPSVLQLAVCLQINLDRWRSLPPAAQRVLEEQAVLYEQRARADFAVREARDIELMARAGMQTVTLDAEAGEAYRRLAHDEVWGRLARRAPEAAARLRPLFYPGTASGAPARAAGP